MADTKVSALVADDTVDAADEFMINEAGTSKKVTGEQLRVFCGDHIRVKLASLLFNDVHTSLVKVTDMDQATGTGTFVFEYFIRYRSDTLASGISFCVNHTGTVTSFVVNARWQEATTLASTGAADQAHATFGMLGAGAARAKSTSTLLGTTTAVDTQNADMLLIVEGIGVCTVDGNIEFYISPETSAGGATVMEDSTLTILKVPA